ncbi:hypothetical protein SMACR_00639 [Sordaria macrospora]|uniref:WGS project CABT00000000 data, contig 2.2 n=2 Tax=Sordaria macrospora TaxID=5147 RepID=F7VMN5_SORMK|nr:uncharacterized protein SMAC_00639 [Sordaria macrospora k-hell]KAA8627898.1 hypothetical protein SMACR_00639 [Sordaria macrospora]WPJ66900.1 hypothetical protein SMAC4_00639 [Sordaria macrospora]CCC06614.1 unnamed protein product [Sordaria macrospora k-hell]
MQAVPSLVGTGTVVAAAATGLVFGQPPDLDPPRPISKRKMAQDYDLFRMPMASPRPGTSGALLTSPQSECFPYSSFDPTSDVLPGPLTSHPTNSAGQRPGSLPPPPSRGNRRQSFIRSHSERSTGNSVRDSSSSRESWLKRLSIRPLSQHGSSPRSSMGPDSPSINFSNNGSEAPMLRSNTTTTSGPQVAPNKLVKRITTGQGGNSEAKQKRGSRSQLPTLRRPATSHQRSMTLQQLQGTFCPTPVDPKFSLEEEPEPQVHTTNPQAEVGVAKGRGRWTSFFHARILRSSGRRSGLRLSESSLDNLLLPSKRVQVQADNAPRPYLTKPDCIAAYPTPEMKPRQSRPETRGGRLEGLDCAPPASPTGQLRRSLSFRNLNSPETRVLKSTNAQRPRRGTASDAEGSGRHAAGPGPLNDFMLGASNRADQPEARPTWDGNSPPTQTTSKHLETGLRPGLRLVISHKRNPSAPLVPMSRIPSLNVDVTRFDQPSPTPSSASPSPYQGPINYMSATQGLPVQPRSRSGGSGEQASTLVGSESIDGRDGLSGDDDDTDLRSDGMYDSFRTGASSSRLRTVETPLESMFDESPPSTAGNSKNKRLSIQEILGQSWDGAARIMEEDKGLPPTLRAAYLSDATRIAHDGNDQNSFELGPTPTLSLGEHDFGRLSLDDDEDDDWARDDDEAFSNHLSPPSTTNSSRVSPAIRQALAGLCEQSNADLGHDALNDRPRSNIFDWCEAPSVDKFDHDGESLRPKTVHGKQILDLRGGRSVIRKGPSAAHIRSQSVPVVPDLAEGSKPTPKFGTWGLSSKTVSEDWDDDFDFEEVPVSATGCKDSATSFSMLVPASIQASQPSVKAHSGQIRELSLLVNDLKRLCRHGKELDILNGPAASKWEEAENIIELASPDEEDKDDADTSSQSTESKISSFDERYLEEGFDGSILDPQIDPFEAIPPPMGKTTVIRERQVARRRSVFSPDDDIFGGGWPLTDGSAKATRPHTPERSASPTGKSAMIATVIEAMQQQRAEPVKHVAPVKPPSSKLFFDTNSLHELVKRAGQLRDSLAETVRRAELLTQTPTNTPRVEPPKSRHNLDGSPAFTRVFTDPSASPQTPQRRLPKSHSTNSVLRRKSSVDSPRLHMMTVS